MKMTVHVGDQAYLFDEDEIENTDLMDIEDVTGLATVDWQDALTRGSGRAITALIWILQRKTDPSLAFRDVKFKLSEISMDIETEDGEPGKEEGSEGS